MAHAIPSIGSGKKDKSLDIAALAAEFTAAPNLDPTQQRLVPAAIRLLGEGGRPCGGGLTCRR